MTNKISHSKSSRLKPVYLRYSSDRLLLDRSVDHLKKGYFSAEGLDFNLNEFYASATRASEIVAACRTLSFFPEKRLVIVWEAEKLIPADLEVVSSYAEKPVDSAVLFLAAIFQKRDDESADSFKKRRDRFLKTFQGKADIKEHPAPKKGDYPGWVRSEFLDRGKVISIPAAKYLVDRIGFDFYVLSNEIEKACLYYNERKELGVEDMERLISQTAAGTIYDLVDAVFERDLSRSLNLLGHFHRNEETARFFYALPRQVRSLLKTKDLLEKGAKRSELVRGLGVQSWLVDKFCRQSQKFSLAELKGALRYLFEADVAIKKGDKTLKLAVESLVIQILGAGKQQGKAHIS